MLSNLRGRWLELILALFAIAAVCCIAWFVVCERRAHREVEAEYARLISLDMPIDDESNERLFRERTHQEGSEIWAEIAHAVVHLGSAGGELPVVGNGELPQRIDPETDWSDEQQVGEYLELFRPVIDRIAVTRDLPRPVWQPLNFSGFNTLLEPLQSARQIMRLLALEAEHAGYNGDAERALEAIQSQVLVAEAFDWSLAIVGELVHTALVHTRYDTIDRTLACELWSVDQLDELLQLVAQPLEASPRLRRAMAHERAMVLAGLGGQQKWLSDQISSMEQLLLLTPSSKLEYLRYMASLENLGGKGLADLLADAAAHDSALAEQKATILLMVAPALESFAGTYLRLEMRRRQTKLAIAVKKYRLENKAWPTDLDDLLDVGVTDADLVQPLGEPWLVNVERDRYELSNREMLEDEDQEAMENQKHPRFTVIVGAD